MAYNQLIRALLFLVVVMISGICLAKPAVAGQTVAGNTPVMTTTSATLAFNVAGGSDSVNVSLTKRQAVQAVAIFVLFLFVAVAIASRKLSAMVALPLLAFGIGILAGIPITGENGILQSIMEGKSSPSPTGAFQLYKAIIWILFGGIFARFISDSRIAERIVKFAAEYGGEDPFFVALLMSCITIIIFTAAGGLPMIIMLGTVMFPILLSLGVPAATSGSILLLSFPIGVSLSPAEWARTSEVFHVNVSTVQVYFLSWAALQFCVLITFLMVEFLRLKKGRGQLGRMVKSVLSLFVAALVFALLVSFEKLRPFVNASWHPLIDRLAGIRSTAANMLQWLVWICLAMGIILSRLSVKHSKPGPWNLITPVLPLVFLLFLGFDNAFIPAFLAALTYGVLTTPQPQALQKLGRTIIDGISDVAAPIILMVGIGMLIAAATHPKVELILTPLLGYVIPHSRWSYVVFFLVVSPLSLYRGPLNEFGLGVGIARLLQTFMSPAATLGALRSVGMLQDPTTTQNIWICGFLKLDINTLLFKLFLYSVVLVMGGLVLSAVLFF